MFDGHIHYQGGQGQYWCEFEATLKGEYCGKRGQVRLDGLLLCEPHARQLCLEEQIAYWRAMLAHIELWSGYARTRGREDIVGLLGTERTKASVALGRVLEVLERGEGDGCSGARGDDYGKGEAGGGGNGRIT
jgi:hypothetical protein